MAETETAAERLAGQIALDIRQGRIAPGGPLPAAGVLARDHRARPADVEQALVRLAVAGLAVPGPDGTLAAAPPGPLLDITAAAAMCRRLTAAGPVPGRPGAQAALEELGARFADAARQAMRTGGLGGHEPLLRAAREILADGPSRPGPAGAAASPATLAWPAAPAAGIAAAARRPPGRRRAPAAPAAAGPPQRRPPPGPQRRPPPGYDRRAGPVRCDFTAQAASGT